MTTDHVGRREVVEEGVNSRLIPVKDSSALADAVRTLLEDEALCRRFSQESRRKAEREFDERLVVSRILTQLYGLETRGGGR